MTAAEAQTLPLQSRLQRDQLADLLVFQPRFGWQSRQRFISDSLKKIEQGHHFYSEVADGVLVHYGWLIDEQERNVFPEAEQEFRFPPGTAVLYDFYTDPTARGRGLYQTALRQLARDAAAKAGTERLLISVLAENSPSRHAIEKIGFRYVGSLFLSTRFGRKEKRSTVPPEYGSPQAPAQQDPKVVPSAHEVRSATKTDVSAPSSRSPPTTSGST